MNLIFALTKVQGVKGRIFVGGLAKESMNVCGVLIGDLSKAISFNAATNIVSPEKWLIFQDRTSIKVVTWIVTDSARETNIIRSC